VLQIAELVREKALQLTREEVPHAVSVEVDEIADKVVRATIFVETESQKQIVIGKGGSVVKQIGTCARPEIELVLGHPVFIDLRVKSRPKWRRDEAMLERLGL
jgi:GTPase